MARRRGREPDDMSAEELGPRLIVMSVVAIAVGLVLLVAPLISSWQFASAFVQVRPVAVSVIAIGAAFGVAAYFVFRYARAKTARFEQTGVTLKELRSLSPAEFEQWCAARLREQGYQVTVVGARGDHGVDLIAEREGSRMVVQCKRWYSGRSVGESDVRDLAGAMQHESASSGMLLTTEQFTPAAMAWAQGKPIKLWNVEQLVAASPVAAVKEMAVAAGPSTESCPSCGRQLVRRTNRTTQVPFWGCTGYPSCRFTRPI